MLAGPDIVTEAGASANLHGVTVGPSGEIIAVGWQMVDGNDEGLVHKYALDGELAWTRTYDGNVGLDDGLRDVVVASDGTIVIAGHAGPLNANGDFWVAALTP